MSILWDVGNYTKIKEIGLPIITTGTINMGNGVYLLKAGTPLDEDGAVSNDGDAVCLVAEDFIFYSNNPTQAKLVKVIERGYVDLGEAEAAAGITYDDACVAALAALGIVLVDGGLGASSIGISVMANQADSTATSVANLKGDFNDLLTKLKGAGLMAPDAET